MVPLPWPVAMAAGMVSLVAVAAIWGRSPVRRVLGWGLGLTLLALPWVTEPEPLAARAVVALGGFLPILRLWDFERDGRDRSAAFRAWAMLMPFDVREATPTRARLDVRSLGALLGASGCLAAGGWIVTAGAAAVGETWAPVARFAGAIVATYFLLEAGDAFYHLVHRAVGLDFPPVQRTPIASRSAREFWGERWNRTVNRWLRRNCFVPLARGGRPWLGTLAAFGASGVLHVWIVLAPLGWEVAGWQAAYFFSQGLLVLAEGPLRVRRWPRPAQHGWTVAAIVGPAPLFIEPMARVFE